MHQPSSVVSRQNYNPEQEFHISDSSTTFKNSAKEIVSRIPEQHSHDYKVITSDLRVQLLQMIDQDGVLIKDASKKLKINY